MKYKMEDAYMRHPYHGGELGFIFEHERDTVGVKGEPQKKGYMVILDPSLTLRSLLEGISPDSPDRKPRKWLSMGNLICIQESKMEDPYHIVHNFIRNMKPIEIAED